jgi:LAGLIDADG DNA endonuclease family
MLVYTSDKALYMRPIFYTSTIYLKNFFFFFCFAAPKQSHGSVHKQTGKVYSRIRFHTCSIPCFTEFYYLFYPEGQKVVPMNIGELLTSLGLAYWIADDGCKVRSIVTLCTESFSLAEVTLLANTLKDKWDLKCYINKTNNGGFRILIPRKSLPILQSLLTNVMPHMMKYKIGL